MNAEQQYIKGFNNGFLLAEHVPHLAQKLISGLQSANDYTNGLLAGSHEYTNEKAISQLNELRQLRDKGRDEQEIDKD